MLFKINSFSTILFLILLLAFLIRTINLNYNSLFLDEATYIVLGKKFLDGDFADVIGAVSWVGGFPLFYPLLSATFFSIYGILATRFLNVILGTVSVFLIYYFTNQLQLFQNLQQNKTAGLVAAAFLSTSTIPIVFSRLAIYDALSFSLFLGGLVILVKAVFTGEKHFYLATAIILFLSFLAKYIVAIFFPILLLIPLYLALKTKNSEKIYGILKYFWLPLLFLMVVYFSLNFSNLLEFIFSQTTGERSSIATIFENFWKYSSIPYFLSFISLGGIFFLLREKRVLIFVSLLLLSFVPLIVHFLTGNALSVHQHSFLSLIFILPVVGSFFGLIIKRFTVVGILITLIIVLFNYFDSVPKVKELEGFWPNTTKAIEILKSKVDQEDKILAEAGDVITLALYDRLKPENITGPFVFSYQNQEELAAYLQAINNGYFNFVELDGTSFLQEQIEEIKKSLGEKYSLIFDDGKIRIWQLKS